ncbi:MAG: DUF2612 domain-containing protein [Desulfobacteraceae bacterium]|nr:DUF2612 domain-containing protein [Desulfobacteraceae bacterium]
MTITTITNHKEQALKRLITQYKNKPNFESIISTFSTQIQELETIYFQLLESRSLDTSFGFQLDQIGTLLNEKRDGFSDSDYRLKLIAKIAVNVSQGTPEDIINIFKILMQANKVELFEYFPATIQLVAHDPQPISSVQRIKDALNRTKPTGVAIDSLIVVNPPPFCFLEVSDLDCKGFRDINLLLETLFPFEIRNLDTTLVIESTPFTFSEDIDPNGQGFRDVNRFLETIIPFSFLENSDPNGSGFDDLKSPGSGGNLSSLIETQIEDFPGDGGTLSAIQETDLSEAHFEDLNVPGSGKDLSAIIETDQSETLDTNSGFFSTVI